MRVLFLAATLRRARPPAPRHRPARAAWLSILLALLLPSCLASEPTLAERDQRLIKQALAAMPPQQPGRPDLYVVGFAGDGFEDVFRNEVLYLQTLMAQRFGEPRSIALVNHPDSLEGDPRPLATLANLRQTLAGIGRAMDPQEDLLLLFVTTHGTEEHELVVQLEPMVDEAIHPLDLRSALDESGIRYRVLVISSCFSGGFLPKLQGPDALVITAARDDRTSFGCGVESDITYFGQAWLVEGLNRHAGFVSAYDEATRLVAAREREDKFEPSLPQIALGEGIVARLHAWQDATDAGPPVPYPHER